IVASIQHHAEILRIPMPEIWMEPGRAIAGNAGITLYTIGSMKHITGVRNYISVEDGMTDNLGPALYQAKYEAVLANNATHPTTNIVCVAERCCESGDMILWDLPVPAVDLCDILGVFSTGFYGYSMASHYNRFPKAAVVFVENGQDKLVIKRENYRDVVRNDLSYI